MAHPNIALIKYWGKRSIALNLPATGSLSVTLDTLHSRCQVRPAAAGQEQVRFNGRPPGDAQHRRIRDFVALALAGVEGRPPLAIDCDNDFPTGAGLASSASGFAALAVALRAAAGRPLPPPALSRLCRQGSGSAARSVFGGFAVMHRGEAADGHDAYAEALAAPDAWPLRVVVAVVSRQPKAVGSTEGMERSRLTSPYYSAWCATAADDLEAGRAAVLGRDFAALAEIAEHSCAKMHALMQSSRPPLVYWAPATLALIQRVWALRHGGVPVFYTCDAGPQLKAVCTARAQATVAAALAEIPGVEEIIACGLGPAAHLVAA